MSMVPPVMMQSAPITVPMGIPVQVAPMSPRPMLPRKQHHEISTSAATKAGAAVFGSIGALRILMVLPIFTEALAQSKKEIPGMITQLTKEMPEPEKAAMLLYKELSRVVTVGGTIGGIIAATIGIGLMAGIGALVGNGTASVYNHFVRKENTRPNYLA